METLEKYLHLATHLTAVAFGKQHPGPFLLKRPSPGSDSIAQPIGFVTALANSNVDPFASQWRLLAVKKREGNPYEDRISIGRASNCDLVLRVPFVSKVQAHILCASDGTYSLRGQNTSNPTLLNNVTIDSYTACPLKYGDEMAFGPMKFEFMDSQRLHKLLLFEARRTGVG